MPVECFPDAPAEWDRKTISGVADVNPRYPVKNGEAYPFVEMPAVATHFGGITRFDEREAGASGLARFRVDDTLFAKITPCPQNGKVAHVDRLPDEHDVSLGSTEFIVLSPRDGTDPRWLYALLCTDAVRGRAAARMEGSTGRQRVPEDVFTKYLLVPVPPPTEQAGIARVLDAVDAAIARTRTAVAEARRVKRALVQRLFTDGIGHNEYHKTPIGRLPSAWDVVPLGDVLTEAQYGLSMPMEEAGQYPILRMAAIQQGDVLLNDLKYVDLPDDLAAKYLLRRGDILFNRTNSYEHVGKIGVYRHDRPAVFASYLIRCKIDPEQVDPFFLGQLLASYAAQCRIRRYATPAVQQVNINASNLRRVLVQVPRGEDGLREQRRIADILERQDASIRRLRAQIDSHRRLKTALMQDLLTGRVRVPVGGSSKGSSVSHDRKVSAARRDMNAARGNTKVAQSGTNAARDVMNAAQDEMNAAQSLMNVAQPVTHAAQTVMNVAQSDMNAAQGHMNAAQNSGTVPHRGKTSRHQDEAAARRGETTPRQAETSPHRADATPHQARTSSHQGNAAAHQPDATPGLFDATDAAGSDDRETNR